jgi:hypothetical protein
MLSTAKDSTLKRHSVMYYRNAVEENDSNYLRCIRPGIKHYRPISATIISPSATTYKLLLDYKAPDNSRLYYSIPV